MRAIGTKRTNLSDVVVAGDDPGPDLDVVQRPVFVPVKVRVKPLLLRQQPLLRLVAGPIPDELLEADFSIQVQVLVLLGLSNNYVKIWHIESLWLLMPFAMESWTGLFY